MSAESVLVHCLLLLAVTGWTVSGSSLSRRDPLTAWHNQPALAPGDSRTDFQVPDKAKFLGIVSDLYESYLGDALKMGVESPGEVYPHPWRMFHDAKPLAHNQLADKRSSYKRNSFNDLIAKLEQLAGTRMGSRIRPIRFGTGKR